MDLNSILQSQIGKSPIGGDTAAPDPDSVANMFRQQQPAQIAKRNNLPVTGGGASAPGPSHANTVAGLMHFAVVERAFHKITRNPKYGKENVRPDVWEEVAKLVGERFFSIPQAMELMKGFPSDPVDQKSWVEKAYNQMQAARLALLQHRSQQAQLEDPSVPQEEYNPDNHSTHVSGLMSKYKR